MLNKFKLLIDQFFNKINENSDNKIVESSENITNENHDDLEIKIEKTKKFLSSVLENIYQNSCPCAYPRIQQLLELDPYRISGNYVCYETEILIDLLRDHFEIIESELNDECDNEKWICKKCASVYEWGWQDFSIAVNRQKLQLIELKAKTVGKEALKPTPLYLGLFGHSYPSREEADSVEFDEFEKYYKEL